MTDHCLRAHRPFRDFLAAGHLPTLLTALLYFDVCFAVWVLNAAMAPFISAELGLTPAQKGLLISVPVLAGALLRFPLGLLSQYIGRKRAAQVEMGTLVVGLLAGAFLVRTYPGALAMGVVLGVAGASFGVALSLGSGSYPPRHKGLAMGIAGAGNSGAVIAVLAAPPLALALGWRAVYGLATLPLLLAMALLALFAREPPDREARPIRDYLRLLADRDAWIFNLMYMVTFGGYIGLASFLPTLLHDQYGIPKESIGPHAAAAIVMASLLRVAGGWLADRVGGVRLLAVLFLAIVLSSLAAATLPARPWAMVAVLALAFSAMGAGNGAVFQLVPLRFKGSTAVAGSLVGEIGALAGGLLPVAMGLGRQWTGSFAPGFLALVVLALACLAALACVSRQWTGAWIGQGGRAQDAELAPAPQET